MIIQTVNSKEDFEKWIKQGDNNTLKVTRKPTAGSLAGEMDTEMKEGTKVVEGLVNSKHMVKNLTEEEIDKIVKEMGWEEEKKEDEDKEIEEKEVKGRNDLFNVPQDSRNALGLIKSILKNNKVVEEFRALPNKKK